LIVFINGQREERGRWNSPEKEKEVDFEGNEKKKKLYLRNS
jgi:hypothetical protein